jgi:ankyrin repeat protein
MGACRNNQAEMAGFLLESGASPNLATPVGEEEDTAAWTFGYVGICRDERTVRGATALFFAAQSGASGIAQMLLEKGAAVDALTANGATPLYIACQMGHKEVVKVLLGGKANPNTKTEYGWAPLFVTAYRGDAENTQLLLDAGADVNAAGRMLMVPKKSAGPGQMGMKQIEGVTALYVASPAGRSDVGNSGDAFLFRSRIEYGVTGISLSRVSYCVFPCHPYGFGL